MGGHTIGGSDEDVLRIHRKVRALNTDPGSYEAENAEEMFNELDAIRAAEAQVKKEYRHEGIRRGVSIGVGLIALTTIQVFLVLVGMKWFGMPFEWAALTVVLLNINISWALLMAVKYKD